MAAPPSFFFLFFFWGEGAFWLFGFMERNRNKNRNTRGTRGDTILGGIAKFWMKF